MSCFKKSSKYSDECLNTCISRYRTAFDLFEANIEWYDKKVNDMKLRGEVPSILLDQVDDDKKY